MISGGIISVHDRNEIWLRSLRHYSLNLNIFGVHSVQIFTLFPTSCTKMRFDPLSANPTKRLNTQFVGFCQEIV